MTYRSDYEITNPLTTVAKQRVINNLGTGKHNGTDIMGWTTTNITGSGSTVGSGNGTDGGYLLRTSSGGTDLSTLNFNDICQYSHTGSVVIWVGMRAADKQAGWGMGSNKSNFSQNMIRATVTSTANTYVMLYTGNAASSEGGTNTNMPNTDVDPFKWKTFKCEQKNGSSELSIDGVLGAVRTSTQSQAAMQPMAYARLASATTYCRYMEAYNT